MNPFSAFYYISKNRARAAVCIIIITMTVGLFLLGNFIQAGPESFYKDYEYGNKLILVNCTSTGSQDYADFFEIVKKDGKLHYFERTGAGYPGIVHKTALGIDMGGTSYVFNSVSDIKEAFKFLGIECDFTNVKNGSLIISKTLAANRGIKQGDIVDHSFDSSFYGTYSVDALIDDTSNICFFVIEDNESLFRFYVYSDCMEGQELYQYIKELAGDLDVLIEKPIKDTYEAQFEMFYVIFYTVVILISIIMAVTVNSVMTGQYIKRKYEFGVYRALGRTKCEVFCKCAKEILSMDLVGIVIGLAVCFLITYLLKELIFEPKGILLIYVSKVAIVGYLLCNIFIIVPVILLNGRMCMKADVTEF